MKLLRSGLSPSGSMLTKLPSYVQVPSFIEQFCTSKGKYSTMISQ
uniref:Uncharacterized protein n=1 Tax=Anguilla anguilla TaxID=7936 RepID=A0A0E9RJ52_ANGAN